MHLCLFHLRIKFNITEVSNRTTRVCEVCVKFTWGLLKNYSQQLETLLCNCTTSLHTGMFLLCRRKDNMDGGHFYFLLNKGTSYHCIAYQNPRRRLLTIELSLWKIKYLTCNQEQSYVSLHCMGDTAEIGFFQSSNLNVRGSLAGTTPTSLCSSGYLLPVK